MPRVLILQGLQERILELSAAVKHAERAGKVAASKLKGIKRLGRSGEEIVQMPLSTGT